MGKTSEYNWEEPHPCPPWCRVTNHLESRLSHSPDHFLHQSDPAVFIRNSIHGQSGDAGIRLSSLVCFDENGENTRRAQFTIDSHGYFSPSMARSVAEATLDWDNHAEADKEWRRIHGLAVGPED